MYNHCWPESLNHRRLNSYQPPSPQCVHGAVMSCRSPYPTLFFQSRKTRISSPLNLFLGAVASLLCWDCQTHCPAPGSLRIILKATFQGRICSATTSLFIIYKQLKGMVQMNASIWESHYSCTNLLKHLSSPW